MASFLLPPPPDPIGAGLQQLASSLGQRFQKQAAHKQQQRQQELLSQVLSGGQTDVVGDDDSDLNTGSQEAQMDKLEQMENLILASGPLTPESKALLQTIRSRRGVIGQSLSAGELESEKLAAKRRSEKIDTLGGKAEAADSTLQAVSQLESLIDSGETGPTARNALINATEGHEGVLGAVNSYLTTVESQGFKSAQLQFFPQLKQLFGSRITDRDLKTFMQSLARFGTDPNAQRLALQTLKQHAEYDSKLGEHVLSLMDENGKPVKGFERKLAKLRKELNSEMTESFRAATEELGISGADAVEMIDPQGFPVLIPKDQIKAAEAAGAKLKR